MLESYTPNCEISSLIQGYLHVRNLHDKFLRSKTLNRSKRIVLNVGIYFRLAIRRVYSQPSIPTSSTSADSTTRGSKLRGRKGYVAADVHHVARPVMAASALNTDGLFFSSSFPKQCSKPTIYIALALMRHDR